jgi:GxxExxY protein
VVEQLVVVELKAVVDWNAVYEAQLLSYLKLSDHKAGLAINFNVPLLKSGIHRMVNNL